MVFRDDAVFHRASLLGPLRLDWVLFDALAHFGSARFQVGPAGAGFVLSYPGFSELELGWGQLPPVSRWRQEDGLQPLSEVLGVLEGRFRANRQLESANAAYYHRKRAELAERRAAAVGGDRDATLAWLIAEAQWWTWGLLCGYGTRLDWLLGWAALTVLLFAALYATAGQFHREPHPPSTRDFEFRQRLFDFPKDFMAGAAHRVDAGPGQRQFIDALRFSAVVLFKIGYRDTTLTGRALGLDLRYFVMLEWLLGYGFLAAFVYTLAETLPLVNRLLGGIF